MLTTHHFVGDIWHQFSDVAIDGEQLAAQLVHLLLHLLRRRVWAWVQFIPASRDKRRNPHPPQVTNKGYASGKSRKPLLRVNRFVRFWNSSLWRIHWTGLDCTGHYRVVLSRPVGAKQLPGPSLPKLLAQFHSEQTGCCKTTPRPFSSQNWWHSLTLTLIVAL